MGGEGLCSTMGSTKGAAEGTAAAAAAAAAGAGVASPPAAGRKRKGQELGSALKIVVNPRLCGSQTQHAVLTSALRTDQCCNMSMYVYAAQIAALQELCTDWLPTETLFSL